MPASLANNALATSSCTSVSLCLCLLISAISGSCDGRLCAVVVNRAGQLDATVQQINAIMDAEKCSAKRLFRQATAV